MQCLTIFQRSPMNLYTLVQGKYKQRTHSLNFYPAQSLDWLGQYVAFQSVCLSVCNNYSPHPPPYIELSFSSSLCWYIYSPQTSQI